MITIPESVRQGSLLFAGLSREETNSSLLCSGAHIEMYPRGRQVFRQQDTPKELLMLVSGSIIIGSNSMDGRQNLVAIIDQPGDIFGEIFLFTQRRQYDYYAEAKETTSVLHMPRNFLYHTCSEACSHHSQLISNMMHILAQKAYGMNQRLQVLSAGNLRQKIARVLLQHCDESGKVSLPMNRVQLASYLSATRPSLSRELAKMNEEGLISIDKKKLSVPHPAQLASLL